MRLGLYLVECSLLRAFCSGVRVRICVRIRYSLEQINVWYSLPLDSDDFRSLHCFRSSLNNIDFNRFLSIE